MNFPVLNKIYLVKSQPNIYLFIRSEKILIYTTQIKVHLGIVYLGFGSKKDFVSSVHDVIGKLRLGKEIGRSKLKQLLKISTSCTSLIISLPCILHPQQTF